SLYRSDTSLGQRWSTQSSHSGIHEAIADRSASPFYSLGSIGIRDQYHYRVSLLRGDARLLHPELRFSTQDIHDIAGRRHLAALLLHERLPQPGKTRAWRRRPCVGEGNRRVFDNLVDSGNCARPIYTVRRSDVDAISSSTTHRTTTRRMQAEIASRDRRSS